MGFRKCEPNVSELIIAHLDFIYLIYGLLFIILAMTAGSLARRQGAGSNWLYLCAFGVIHGLSEWLDMVAPVVGAQWWFALLRGIVLSSSYVCLFEFGRRGVTWHWKWRAGRWIYLPGLLVILYGVKLAPEDVLSLIRVCLGFPAGLLAALALWQNGVMRSTRPVQRWPNFVGPVALGLYALSTGLIVPPAHFWPAHFINTEWFLDRTGIPVQVVRCLLAGMAVLAIWSDFDNWRVQTYPPGFIRRIRYARWIAVASVSIALGVGWVLVERAGRLCREDQEARLRSLSRSMAVVINPKKVLALKGDSSDAQSPVYLDLKLQCQRICEADPAVRYLYLMTVSENRVLFLVDVEPARYHTEVDTPNAAPGEVYEDAPPEIFRVFHSGETLIAKPYSDAWGMFISSYSPIVDFGSGAVIAVIGVDTPGLHWLQDVAMARLLRLLLTGGAVLLLLLFAVLWRREIEESYAQNVNGQRMQLQQSALLRVANSSFVAEGNVFMMARNVTCVISEVINVQRVELWLKGSQGENFRAEDIFHSKTESHHSGKYLHIPAEDSFLALLESGRVTPTSGLQEDARFGNMRNEWGVDTRAVLVAPLRVSGKVTGWLAAVQAGRYHNWLTDEMRFIAEMADQVVHTLINHERRLAEEALRRAHNELELRVHERTEALSRKNEELAKEMAERRRMEQVQRRLQDKMQQAQKLESLGLMAGGIAHDFNNILMAVLGNVELARLETPKESAVYEYLQDIDKASSRAADLARQMLIYSGRGHAIIQGIELNDMVRDMTSILKVSLGKRIQLAYELEQGLPLVDGDMTQMRQVLMNLVINASEAIGPESGVITLRTGEIQYDKQMMTTLWLKEELPEGPYVYLDVEDTGCGMDEATVKRIFDPFFTTKFTGRGLGLAAVLGIVKGHNGAIDVTSVVGKGTQFRILLPPGRRPGYEKTLAQDVAALSWRGEGTILFADDESAIRTLARRMLERSGFSVLEAGDGNEAIGLFKQHHDRICCVMLDLTMPDLNGKEAFEVIRMMDPTAKVVLCSGYMEDNLAAKFPDWNVSGFLQKPFKYEALMALLRSVLKG